MGHCTVEGRQKKNGQGKDSRLQPVGRRLVGEGGGWARDMRQIT